MMDELLLLGTLASADTLSHVRALSSIFSGVPAELSCETDNGRLHAVVAISHETVDGCVNSVQKTREQATLAMDDVNPFICT